MTTTFFFFSCFRFSLFFVSQSTNQPNNQSINQCFNQPINQSINHPTNQFNQETIFYFVSHVCTSTLRPISKYVHSFFLLRVGPQAAKLRGHLLIRVHRGRSLPCRCGVQRQVTRSGVEQALHRDLRRVCSRHFSNVFRVLNKNK